MCYQMADVVGVGNFLTRKQFHRAPSSPLAAYQINSKPQTCGSEQQHCSPPIPVGQASGTAGWLLGSGSPKAAGRSCLGCSLLRGAPGEGSLPGSTISWGCRPHVLLWGQLWAPAGYPTAPPPMALSVDLTTTPARESSLMCQDIMLSREGHLVTFP